MHATWTLVAGEILLHQLFLPLTHPGPPRSFPGTATAVLQLDAASARARR